MTPMMNDAAARLAALEARLAEAGVEYQILTHDHNVATVQDGVETGLADSTALAPTFILRTEAGYMAAIVRGDTRLIYKKIKQKLGLKDVSLATPDQVRELTGAEVGTVALVNPGLPTLLDERLLEKEAVYGGCGAPNHTLRIAPAALAAATGATVFDFTEIRG